MGNPTAAIVVIGDEILSGRTRDANMHHLAERLTEAGIDLLEARVVSDDHDAIVTAVRAMSDAYTYVFTSGGIGPTHDDITADAVADAFQASIDVRDDARKILESYYANSDLELNSARLRMARIPEGAVLIDNPVSFAPGFRIENVHVMAGVPRIFAAMLAAVLPGLKSGTPIISETLRVLRPEGEIAGVLSKVVNQHSETTIGSYPFYEDGKLGCNVVFRGNDQKAITAALSALKSALEIEK